MKYIVRISSVLLFIVFGASCRGQNFTDPPKVKEGQTESNLADSDPYFVETRSITSSYGPGSITRNIIQDRNGNIWLAAWEGIIKYEEGVLPSGQPSFTNFTNSDSLRRFHVFSVLEDSQGIIWFGTIGAGVYRYDASAEHTGGKIFTNITTKQGLASDRVGCIYEDNAGNIWFGTDGGASRYDGISFHNFTTKNGLADNDINSIIEDKAGKFWFGTRGDASYYDGESFTTFKNEEGLPFKNVRCIIEDSKGNKWFGGNDGLWRYDNSSFTNFTSDFVGYIYEDKQGNIWTSSEATDRHHTWVLSRYDEESLYDGRPAVTQVLKQEGMFFGIVEDKAGGIWLGTLDGVCRYNGKAFDCFEETRDKE